MSRAEAAAYLHLSLAIFDRDVRPQLPAWRKQRPIRFLKEDIDRWVEEQKAMNSAANERAVHSMPQLRSVPSATSSPLAQKITRELERKLERRRAANG